jgi:hypothetical protein
MPSAFDNIFGTARGSKRQLHTWRAQAQRAKAEGFTDDGHTRSQVGLFDHHDAHKATCTDCGHKGLECKHWVKQSTRRIVKVFVSALVLLIFLAPALSMESFSIVFLVAGIVSWNLFKDAGRKAMWVCPGCESTHRPGWDHTPTANTSGR